MTTRKTSSYKMLESKVCEEECMGGKREWRFSYNSQHHDGNIGGQWRTV